MQLKNNKWIIIVVVFNALFCVRVQAAPQFEGRWTSVLNWPVIAIHSVLTPQGKVMNFGTDKNGLQGARFFYDVWDPKLGSGANSHNTLPNTLGVDSFCSAAIVLPESGNILMPGGDSRPFGTPNFGVIDSPIFNTKNNALRRASNMSYARWYPTSTVLSNGEILVVGGKDGSGRPVNTPEVYSPATNRWRSLFNLSTAGYPELYPRQWVAPDGRVFGIFSDKTMYYLNLRGSGSTWFLDKLPVSGNVFQSTSVMYRRGKILHVGGTGNRTNDSVIININSGKPWVRAVSKPQQAGRSWVNSVVLPNGKVLIVGGSREDNKLAGASYRPEIWDPGTERWSLMAPAVKARLYHSTALLLKDGRVLVAGGGAPGPQTNTNAEIFSPPYLFNGSALAPRPKILSAPVEAPYGSKVTVNFRSSEKISRVTLIKTGTVTHSFNMEQRFLELSFSEADGGIRVNIPTSPNNATPGYYLLHLINNKGVPSEGHIIRISKTAWQTRAMSPYPTATLDKVSTTSGATFTINALANDKGRGLVLSAPNRWSLRGGNVYLLDNNVVYKSKPGFKGTDKIWYVFSDYLGRKNSGQIDITVYGSGPSFYPIAVTDWSTTKRNTPVNINVLANDIGSGLSVNEVNQYSVNGATITIYNNQLRYTPRAGFVGNDSFWYAFKDSQGRTNSAKVTVNVRN